MTRQNSKTIHKSNTAKNYGNTNGLAPIYIYKIANTSNDNKYESNTIKDVINTFVMLTLATITIHCLIKSLTINHNHIKRNDNDNIKTCIANYCNC